MVLGLLLRGTFSLVGAFSDVQGQSAIEDGVLSLGFTCMSEARLINVLEQSIVHTQVWKVGLAHTGLSGHSRSFRCLLQLLQRSESRVTELVLNHCPLGDEGARLLALALPKTLLTTVKLVGCCICNRGARALIAALAQSPQVKKMTVSLNHFSGADGGELRRAVRRLPGYDKFDLHTAGERVLYTLLDPVDYFRTGPASTVPITLVDSRYKMAYDEAQPYTSFDEALGGMMSIVQSFIAAREGSGLTPSTIWRRFAEDHVNDVRKRCIAAGVPALPSEVLLCIVAWTMTEPCCGDLELYRVIQVLLREDCGNIIHVAKFMKTLNKYLVVRGPEARRHRELPAVVYRCANMPQFAIDEFTRHVGTEYRYPGCLATSEKVKEEFFEGEHVKVQFNIEFEDGECLHVNFLEDMTTVNEEFEWLFAPYSAFRVRRVEAADNAGVRQVFLTASKDNKLIRETAPLLTWH